MKKIPSCDECGENDTILTQVSNFSDIKYLCTACHQLKYLEDNSNKILNYAQVDNICEECKKKDENVKSNLIMSGYKICNSCKTSKTIFPI
jgi:hypothetical protein